MREALTPLQSATLDVLQLWFDGFLQSGYWLDDRASAAMQTLEKALDEELDTTERRMQ